MFATWGGGLKDVQPCQREQVHESFERRYGHAGYREKWVEHDFPVDGSMSYGSYSQIRLIVTLLRSRQI